jgi:hypothetical protein
MVNWISDSSETENNGQHVADWRDVTSGVQQGNILLAPLLVFNINDMPYEVNHVIKMFADDNKLIPADLEVLQRGLDAIPDWSTAWSMMFNVKKCKVMEFSKSDHSKVSSTELRMGKFRSVLNFNQAQILNKPNQSAGE